MRISSSLPARKATELLRFRNTELRTLTIRKSAYGAQAAGQFCSVIPLAEGFLYVCHLCCRCYFSRDSTYKDIPLPAVRWSTYLKLCLVALITEGVGGNFHLSSPGRHSSSHNFHAYSPGSFTSGRIAVVVAIAVVAIVLGCVLYYLITRLRFAYFHCLIHNTREIRPGWRLYREQATRFFWLSVVVGFFSCWWLQVCPSVCGRLLEAGSQCSSGWPS